MSRIENITDQLGAFAEEVASTIDKLEERGFSREEAIKITELAIRDMEVEVNYKKIL